MEAGTYLLIPESWKEELIDSLIEKRQSGYHPEGESQENFHKRMNQIIEGIQQATEIDVPEYIPPTNLLVWTIIKANNSIQ